MVSTTEQTAVLSSSDPQSFLGFPSSKVLVLYPASHQWFPFKEWEKYVCMNTENRNETIYLFIFLYMDTHKHKFV